MNTFIRLSDNSGFQIVAAGSTTIDTNTVTYTRLAIAFGLAFGLGGQDAATRSLEKLRKDITHR